ncbi:MAG TPA: hypothetical protein DCF78_10050, partial [Dehalococcoidia bacterium]|nr:hypothetical protein [Dehalococcoidia bacterium]
MCWTAMDRAASLAMSLGKAPLAAGWRRTA